MRLLSGSACHQLLTLKLGRLCVLYDALNQRAAEGRIRPGGLFDTVLRHLEAVRAVQLGAASPGEVRLVAQMNNRARAWLSLEIRRPPQPPRR